MPQLAKYEKSRAVNYGMSHPEASDDEIIEDGKKPRIKPTVILSLSKEVDDALNRAKYQLSMDRESIAEKALHQWLKDNGFLKLVS